MGDHDQIASDPTLAPAGELETAHADVDAGLNSDSKSGASFYQQILSAQGEDAIRLINSAPSTAVGNGVSMNTNNQYRQLNCDQGDKTSCAPAPAAAATATSQPQGPAQLEAFLKNPEVRALARQFLEKGRPPLPANATQIQRLNHAVNDKQVDRQIESWYGLNGLKSVAAVKADPGVQAALSRR